MATSRSTVLALAVIWGCANDPPGGTRDEAAGQTPGDSIQGSPAAQMGKAATLPSAAAPASPKSDAQGSQSTAAAGSMPVMPAVNPAAVLSGSVDVDESKPSGCQLDGPRPLAIRWLVGFRPGEQQPVPIECGALGRCSPNGYDLAAAPDGSLWVAGIALGAGNDGPRGVWLAHHAADGERLSWQLIDIDESGGLHEYAYDIACNDAGEVLLAVTRNEYAARSEPPIATSSWLERYAADAQRVGDRIELGSDAGGGAPMLAVSGDDGVAFAHLLGETVSVIGPDGILRWQQTRSGLPPIRRLVAARDGRVSLLAFSEYEGESHGSADLRVEQYDSDGMLALEYRFATSIGRPDLGIDGEGHLLRTGYVKLEDWEPALIVDKLLPGAGSAWVARVPAHQGLESNLGRLGGELFPAVADGDGTLFFIGGISQPDDVYHSNFYEVSADGQSCRLHALRSAVADRNDFIEQIALARDGTFYFNSGEAYGRFER